MHAVCSHYLVDCDMHNDLLFDMLFFQVVCENNQTADQMNVTHLPCLIPPAAVPDSESDSGSEDLVIDMGEECPFNSSLVTTDTKVSLFPAKLLISLPVSQLDRIPKNSHGKGMWVDCLEV